METKHAKAFLKVALANKGLMGCAEGFLGVDTCPEKLEDFDSSDPAALDRVESFLGYAVTALQMIRAECACRTRDPRQKDTTEAIREAKEKAAKDKAERQKTSKGDPAGRQRAVAALTGEKAPSKKTIEKRTPSKGPGFTRAAGSISRSKGRKKK